MQSFFRSHNHLVDPTRMVHRRVYEAVGGYDDRFPLANDFDFWLRAARRFRFRHCRGGPLIAIRRHGENTSDERAGAQEVRRRRGRARAALERLHRCASSCPSSTGRCSTRPTPSASALLRLADALERRLLPLPRLAESLRRRAAATAGRPLSAHAPAASRRAG